MGFLLIDNYYNIISVFDNKCLIYKSNKLDINNCNKNNKDFIINNNTLCSKVNNVNCLYDYKSYEYI